MMGRIIVVIKAIITRVMFASHGLVAIWRATTIKHDPYYWYLTASILALTFEGVFTLTIKKNQEWKWFCPSVFFYLCSVVPAIWIIEVDKFDRRLATMEGLNITADGSGPIQSLGIEALEGLVQIPQFDPETWATVIEQLLMLILIIGRWMLPKGGLTRDQLSQLLLVYIGTAADIIEFFDTFKEPKIAAERVLCLMILAIWSWSLLQFTFVLTATKARRTRLSGVEAAVEAPPKPRGKFKKIVEVKQVCCTIDVWAILINIILQDAPFLVFRLLLILYFRIITYMNVFFTCKNTLVIVLQFYRLFVVQVERKKEQTKAQIAAAKAGGCGAGTGGKNLPSGMALAMAVERAAFMGPSGVGAAMKGQKKKTKGGSEDGVDSRDAGRRGKGCNSPKNQFRGRRKSLSTGNLVAGAGNSRDDDGEVGGGGLGDRDLRLSGSMLSGHYSGDDNDTDSTLESNVAVRFENEGHRGHHRKMRLGEIKTSGGSRSRSSETGSASGRKLSSNRSRQGHRDTGYSSSSKESSDRLAGGRRPKPSSNHHNHNHNSHDRRREREREDREREVRHEERDRDRKERKFRDADDRNENERI